MEPIEDDISIIPIITPPTILKASTEIPKMFNISFPPNAEINKINKTINIALKAAFISSFYNCL